MTNEILERYNPWWTEPYTTPGIPRSTYIENLDKLVETRRFVLIYGLRRTGKTTIMKQFVAHKLNKIKPEKILFVSIDHPAFSNLSIQEIIDEYRKKFKISRATMIYVFIDEIQYRQNFERELKSIYDLEDKIYLIASGSNSLLIKHKSGALVGRHARINVLPLSFEEFLVFKNIKIRPSERYIRDKLLEEYMEIGGMPEYVLTEDPQYIEDMVEDVIYKDIAIRYNVKDPYLMKDLFYLLCNRVGKRVTSSKLGRLLKLSHDTIRNYLTYFQETFLIDLIEKEGSPNERKYGPKKVYVADQGILNVIGGNIGRGPKVENLVYLTLRNKDPVRYIDIKGKEIDFFSKKKIFEVKYKDNISSDEVEHLVKFKKRNVNKKIMIAKKKFKINGIEVIKLDDFIRKYSK